MDALLKLLADDVRFVSDGGGKVPAALQVIEGADRTSRFVAGAVKKGLSEVAAVRFGLVNDLPGVVLHGADGSAQSVAFEIEGDRIRTIYVVRNPDKLGHLARAARER